LARDTSLILNSCQLCNEFGLRRQMSQRLRELVLHSFLSPLSNKRDDRYGGGIENRIRFPLDLVEAARAEWPHDKPLFVRISAVDGVDVGWTIDDTIVFAKALAGRGVDVVDCSTPDHRAEAGRGDPEIRRRGSDCVRAGNARQSKLRRSSLTRA